MADIHEMDGSRYNRRMEELDKREDRASEYLAGGGGPPHDGDMEARVSRLEEDYRKISDKLDDLRTGQAEIKGELKRIPSTLQLLGFVLVVLIASGAFRFFGE